MINNYVTLPSERVLYISKMGDYNVIGPEAVNEMKTFLTSVKSLDGTRVFSISYDDPAEKPLECRFDFFAAVADDIKPQAHIKATTLEGGRFALFQHQGPDHQLEPFIRLIYTQWHLTHPKDSICGMPRLQHRDLYNPSIPEDQRKTDIFIPVTEGV